jgi:superfamily I DNA/RNA helicase
MGVYYNSAGPLMAPAFTDEQVAIFDGFRSHKGNIIVEAFAGTGKTFTIVHALEHAPEPRIALCAFNQRIKAELAEKVSDPRAEVLTLHALGARAVRQYWERIGIDKTGARSKALADAVCGQQAPDALKRLVSRLESKGREMVPEASTPAQLEPIAIQFDCEPDERWKEDGYDTAWVCARALDAMELAAAQKPIATGIDFADMLYLPLKNRWLRPAYDLVVVDEAQDMTATQLALAQGSCKGRIVVVGDRHQAIYGFRGADSESLSRLEQELRATRFTLSTTFRCGRAIVAEAQRFVPRYQAAPSNSEGEVLTRTCEQLYGQVRVGDFVLSRVNAPLVSIVLTLIRRGVPARIEGRDIAAGLKAIVNKLATGNARNSVPAFLEKLEAWKDREIARAEAANLEGKVQLVMDQHETLLALTDGVAGVSEILLRLDRLFGDAASQGGVVVCSSVHRAKGLEADRTWMLRKTFQLTPNCGACRKRQKTCTCPSFTPDPMGVREENNLEYVAITRAKHTLVYVTDRP